MLSEEKIVFCINEKGTKTERKKKSFSTQASRSKGFFFGHLVNFKSFPKKLLLFKSYLHVLSNYRKTYGDFYLYFLLFTW